jgi:hypothetical protein
MSDMPPPLPPAIDAGRTGPVWEQPGSVFNRFLETVREVLLNPQGFFRTMRRTGGLGGPLTFGVAGTLIGSVIGSLYQLMFMSMGGGMGDLQGFGEGAAAALFSTGCIVIAVPIVAVIGMFIGAAIYHLMLMLLGAARFPFETTMRVVAYSMGATSILNVVPVCGGIAAAIWAIVANIIGLAQAQETTIGKAAAAVLLPVLICCVVLGLFYLLAFAAVMGALSGAWQA